MRTKSKIATISTLTALAMLANGQGSLNTDPRAEYELSVAHMKAYSKNRTVVEGSPIYQRFRFPIPGTVFRIVDRRGREAEIQFNGPLPDPNIKELRVFGRLDTMATSYFGGLPVMRIDSWEPLKPVAPQQPVQPGAVVVPPKPAKQTESTPMWWTWVLGATLAGGLIGVAYWKRPKHDLGHSYTEPEPSDLSLSEKTLDFESGGRLVVRQGIDATEFALPEGNVKFGRSRTNVIPLNSPYVSSFHGYFSYMKGLWHVYIDNGASNETLMTDPTTGDFVPLERGRHYPLPFGSILKIGPVQLQLEPANVSQPSYSIS